MNMNYNGKLVMPSNFIVMNAEEMTYVDGGYKFSMARSKAANIIDVASIIVMTGLSANASVGKLANKMGWSKLQSKVMSSMIKLGVSQSAAKTAVNILKTVTGFSIGTGAAWVLDKTDRSGLNGYIQY